MGRRRRRRPKDRPAAAQPPRQPRPGPRAAVQPQKKPSIFARALRAAFFIPSAYEGLDDDPWSALQALGVGAAAAISLGVGFRDETLAAFEGPPVLGFLWAANTVIVGWVLWTLLAFFIGSRILGGTGNFRQILRALGFAFAPGVLLGLRSTPDVGGALYFVVIVWILASGTLALKETLKISWLKAVPVGVIGWFVTFGVVPLLFLQIAPVE